MIASTRATGTFTYGLMSALPDLCSYQDQIIYLALCPKKTDYNRVEFLLFNESVTGHGVGQ